MGFAILQHHARASSSTRVFATMSPAPDGRSEGDARRPWAASGRWQALPVDFERRGQVALITLNRPEKLNALDGAMMRRRGEIWREFRAADGLRVAIVTGAGDRSFCSGRDLGAAAPGSPEYHRQAREREEDEEEPG